MYAYGSAPDLLNDDTLGRALDALHGFGVTELFTFISQRAVSRLGLSPKVAHLDSTSFHVDGRYETEEKDEDSPGVVRLVQGYSRDYRPDLNQVVLQLIAENKASLPLVMAPLSGNTSDKISFAAAIENHIEQLKVAGIKIVVMDSAGFKLATIAGLEASGVTWVMSVPGTNNQTKNLLADPDMDAFEPVASGCEARSVEVEYAGVSQRWLVIRSEATRDRTRRTVERRFLKLGEEERKRFDTLCRQEFSCEADARHALEAFGSTSKLLEVHEADVREIQHYAKRGRPGKDSTPERITYSLSGALATPLAAFEEQLEAMRFNASRETARSGVPARGRRPG